MELTPHPARVPMKRIGIAGHPLPQGGEGSEFELLSPRSPRRQRGRG